MSAIERCYDGRNGIYKCNLCKIVELEIGFICSDNDVLKSHMATHFNKPYDQITEEDVEALLPPKPKLIPPPSYHGMWTNFGPFDFVKYMKDLGFTCEVLDCIESDNHKGIAQGTKLNKKVLCIKDNMRFLLAFEFTIYPHSLNDWLDEKGFLPKGFDHMEFMFKHFWDKSSDRSSEYDINYKE